MRGRAIFAKDVRTLVRSPLLLGTLLLYPLLLVLVVGLAFANPPDMPTLAVVNDDAGSPPERIGDRNYTTQDLLDIAAGTVTLRPVGTAEEARALVSEGSVDGALLIPVGFLHDALELGTRASITLVVDESDPVRALAAESSVRGALQQFGQRVVEAKVEGVREFLDLARRGTSSAPSVRDALDMVTTARDETPPGATRDNLTRVRNLLVLMDIGLGRADPILTSTATPITLREESVTSGTLDLRDVVLPAAATFSLFWTGTLAAAALTAEERAGAAYLRARASPTPLWNFLASKAALTLLLVLLQGMVALAVADLAWGMPPTPKGLAVAALLAGGLAAAGVGVLLASFARTPGEASLFAVLALVPSMFLAGVFYPLQYMPPAVGAVAAWLPMTQTATALREVLLKAPPLAEAAAPLLGLAATGLALLAAGALLQARKAS